MIFVLFCKFLLKIITYSIFTIDEYQIVDIINAKHLI